MLLGNVPGLDTSLSPGRGLFTYNFWFVRCLVRKEAFALLCLGSPELFSPARIVKLLGPRFSI